MQQLLLLQILYKWVRTIAGAYFETGDIKKESVGNRTFLVSFIYLILAPLPTAFLMLSMLQTLTLLKVIVLVCLFAISLYSFTTWLKNKKS